MSNYVYTMVDLRKIINGKEILKGIYLSFMPGAKIGVLGLNGAGKSTLLRIMAGVDDNFNGQAFPAKGLKIGYLPQEPELDMSKTVIECVEEAVAETKAILKAYEDANMELAETTDDDKMTKLMDKISSLQDEIEAKNAWELDHTIELAMDALRCPPPDAQIKHLSGGEKRRVALARLVLSKSDMLLLDEPTNHLDAESVQWLEQYLQNFPGTVVAITHDRYFLDNVAGWILELDRGSGIPWKGNYSSWLEQKAKRLEQEEKTETARQKTLENELEWIRMAPKARHAKNKARISRFNELQEQSFEKEQKIKEIAIPQGPRLGDLVINAEGLSKAFGDKILFQNLDFRLPPGGIVGIIGANGAGKTTLFKMFAGLEKPDSGKLIFGETVKISYVEQERSVNEKTVFQEIANGEDKIMVGTQEVPSRAYIAKFGFRGTDQNKGIHQLSGGERNRINLAKSLIKGGNVLLLDEPTNDLDVDTLRALEEALSSFAGCAVVISHDRWFLDRIATHMLAFEGDSKVVWFEGNYQDYLADKQRRMGAEAISPKRIRYRPIEQHA